MAEKNDKRSFREILLTKFQNSHWIKIVIVALLFTAPHFLKSFFPLPNLPENITFWHVQSLMPWVYIFTLVVRGAVLIFIVWAVVKLVTSDD
jgi:membrane protease YdiL (CAAX protease family)